MPAGCSDDDLAERLGAIALMAAVPVMQVYAKGPLARLKADQSPVTEADELSEAAILAQLAAQFPDVPVIAEESSAAGRRPVPGREVFLVDPLDGTREFLAHNGEFTVNIALAREGVPVCGVIYAPALERLWIAGTQAFEMSAAPGAALPPVHMRRRLRVREARHGLIALISRSHLTPQTQEYLDAMAVTESRAVGSSLKFGLIASGEADLMIRIGPTMEWDTAAGDAVLRAAGGHTTTLDGTPLRYGRLDQDFRNPDFMAGTPDAGVYPKTADDSLRL